MNVKLETDIQLLPAKSVDSVIKWTMTETVAKSSQAEVTYTRGIVSSPAWAERPRGQQVFRISGQPQLSNCS